MWEGDNIANIGVKRLHNDVSVCSALPAVKDGVIEGSWVGNVGYRADFNILILLVL